MPNPTKGSSQLIASGDLPGQHARPGADAMFQADHLAGASTSATHPVLSAAKKRAAGAGRPKRRCCCAAAQGPTVRPVTSGPLKADFGQPGVKNVTSVDVDACVQATFGIGGRRQPTHFRRICYLLRQLPRQKYEPPPFCPAARGMFDAVSGPPPV